MPGKTPGRLLLTVLALTMCGTVFAAEDLTFSQGDERHLGGHGFLPSQYIPDPFVSTIYRSHVGGASAPKYKREFHDLDGDLLFTLEGSIAFAKLGMDYQQHLGRNWAVGLGGSGLIRSGTNALSFIDDGANVNSNIDAWTKRLLRRGENSQLTAGISWRYSSITYFTPRDFGQHLIDGGSLATAPFVVTAKTWQLQADLLWAYAFNPTYAIRATGSFGVIEDAGDGDEPLGNNRVGVMGEVDFKDQHNFPLGVTLGYFRGFPTDRIGSGLGGTVLGFWFTGQQAFVIGLETGWLEIPADNEGHTIDGGFGSFTIKYYF